MSIDPSRGGRSPYAPKPPPTDPNDPGAEIIARAIAQLEEGILQTAAETEVPFAWQTGKTPEPNYDDLSVANVMLIISRAVVQRVEHVKVEPRRGRWVLTYERARLGAEKAEVSVMLRDAPLLVRRAFLREAQAFTQAYQSEIQRVTAERRGRVNGDLALAAEADAALRILGKKI